MGTQLTLQRTRQTAHMMISHSGLSRFHSSILMIVICLLFSHLTFAQQTTEIYETYLSTDKLIPVLEPLLEPDDKITGYRNKLFVKARPATQDELLSILEKIDRPLKNIQISLRFAETQQHQSEHYGVSASSGNSKTSDTSNEQEKVVVYHGSSRSDHVEVEVMAKRTISTQDNTSDQQIRVLEGEQGTLSVGKERAQKQLVFLNPIQAGVTTEYRYIGNQLFVIPQIVKNKIRVEVHSTNQQIQRRNKQNIDKTSSHTVLLLEPGVWTPMAGASTGQAQNQKTLTHSTRSKHQRTPSLQIKALILP